MATTSRWRIAAAAAIVMVWSVPILGQGYSRGPSRGEGLVEYLKPSGTTPRTPDGKPDLAGMYTAGKHWFNWGIRWIVPQSEYSGARCEDCRGEAAQAVMDRSTTNKPIYKPEYWQQVQDLDFGLVTGDPQFSCRPQGVPRMGIPLKIAQRPNEIMLWHLSYPEGYRTRIVPLDGRQHQQEDREALTSDGIPVGSWDGDTLVIESVGFNDETWLEWPGYIHSNQMTVTERIWRDGDLLYWQATVTDAVMLQEPWVMDPQVRRLNPDSTDFVLEESLPCEQQDGDILLKIAPRYRG